MARNLTPALSAVMVSQLRRPAYKVEIYDLRSTAGETTPSTINDVVSGAAMPTIVGPRDFTDEVESVGVSESGSDYVRGTISATAISIDMIDAHGTLDPLLALDGESANIPRFLRQGNVVRLYEGDLAVDDEFWPCTFTGEITGQPGYIRNPESGQSLVTVEAADRSAHFAPVTMTSQAFPDNYLFQDMVEDIAQDDMGLGSDELALPGTYAQQYTKHVTNQFVMEPVLNQLAKILFQDGYMPYFNGEGKLALRNGIITKSPARVYADDTPIARIDRPPVPRAGVNFVTVKGISADKSLVAQSIQDLATIQVTMGFFCLEEDIPVWWSEDRTLQARNTRMRVERSINGGILPVGSEEYTEHTLTDGGSLGGMITVSTGFAPWIVAALSVGYLKAASQPDVAPQAPSGALPTISVGRLVEAGLLASILLVMSTIGKATYVVEGEPYEYCFEEVAGTAQIEGLAFNDRVPLEITNHLISSAADCNTIAMRILKRERKKQNRRTVNGTHDLVLEPDDVFQTANGRRYMIESCSRTLQRDGTAEGSMEVFEVTDGVRP